MCVIMPKPGKIKMYTSGWPKNQNKCWYKIGSPPPVGSKNDVLKFRSVNSMVMAPANTGKANNSSNVVMNTDQTNNGICSNFIFFARIFRMVVIMLIAPKIDEIPARCNEKIVISIDLF